MEFVITSDEYTGHKAEPYDCENIWFTSDTHFKQERAFTLSKRDKMFPDVSAMSLEMFKQLVSIPKDDLLIHVGDVGDMSYMKLIISEHPNTILVLGNYEKDEMKKYDMTYREYRKYLIEKIGFKDVFYNYALLNTMNGKVFVITHDPKYFTDHMTKGIDESQIYCLFGHIHGRQLIKRFGIDVGVDGHHFKPISFDDVMFYIEAIEKHYDESVFC